MKYLIIQNIITPYRVSLFNSIARKYPDFQFEVLYMSRTEPDRSWDIKDSDLHFDFKVFTGIHKTVKGVFIHWNWSLIKYIIASKDATIIVGGSWNELNNIVLCILKRLGIINNRIAFWSEANYLTIGSSKKNKLRDFLRRFVYKTSLETVILPGEMSIKSFELWNISFRNIIRFPNTIEEEAYESKIERKSLLDTTPKFLLPVRLIEKLKGIVNFFKSIGPENIRKATFYVCGDGPDKELIEKYILDNDLLDNIKLMGWCDSTKMKELYKECDALILPSFSDPSPLSVVEALYASMPLLVSERCGNHFEAVSNSKNGFTFNPYSSHEIKNAYENLLNRRGEWGEMGSCSRRIFEEIFAQDIVIRNLIKSLNQIY